MQLARRKHSRAQYENIIGGKPEGTQQCAELSSGSWRWLRPCSDHLSVRRRSATSGRQDFKPGTRSSDSRGRKPLTGRVEGQGPLPKEDMPRNFFSAVPATRAESR